MRFWLSPSTRFLVTALAASQLLASGYAGSIDHAKITEVVNDVSVVNPQTTHSAHARADQIFAVPNLMKTGPDSRSEMIADDMSVTRVGADTIFSFEPRERLIDLHQGSVLFHSDPGKGGGTIRTVAATAAVLGPTIIVSVTKHGAFKLLVLVGTATATTPNGKKQILHSGQMVFIPPGGKIPGSALTFRLKDEVKTAQLIRGFKNQLSSWGKIQEQINIQEAAISAGTLSAQGGIVDPNSRINSVQALHLFPKPASAPAAPVSTPPPAPTPRQTGRPGGGGKVGAAGGLPQ